MPKGKTDTGDEALSTYDRPPVLAVRLGRGRTGGTTGLSWLIDRARNMGREVIPADGDRRNATLKSYYPDATQPPTDETADVKEWLTHVLSQMAESGTSMGLDLGGGDRVLAEYGRDLGLVEFCEEIGAQPLALYFLGPDTADFEHVLTIARAGYFKPERSLLILNENLISGGRTPAGAFEGIISRSEFVDLVRAGMHPINMPTLPCMEAMRELRLGFYDAAAGRAGPGGRVLDPVRRFMVKRWLAHLEKQVANTGATEWLP